MRTDDPTGTRRVDTGRCLQVHRRHCRPCGRLPGSAILSSIYRLPRCKFRELHPRSSRRRLARPSPAAPPPGSTPPPHSRPGSPASGCRTASGRSFHSSTVRPRPSVFTRYSAVRCSAKSRCRSGLSPKSDRHPGRPSAPPAGHGRTTSSSWCRTPRAAPPACPGRWGSASCSPTRSPSFRLYSENGMLDAPTNRPWLGNEHGRMGTLPAELVDHVGRDAPVGVDQAALDPHLGPVVPPPLAAQAARRSAPPARRRSRLPGPCPWATCDKRVSGRPGA